MRSTSPGGRLARSKGVDIPVEQIAIDSSREWLRRHLSHLDPQRHVRLLPHIRPTSPELASLFHRGRGPGGQLANDTSFGVGFAPLDTLERVVLAVERVLNAAQTKAACPEIGEDIKVMGARHGAHIVLTIACALVGQHVANLADYRAKKQHIRALAMAAARTVTELSLEVHVNAADDETAGSVYLTVTGLSAESGDDGQVGRGNRVNGLLTPYRPMSLEAAAGKNPVTHVGKLYNVMANRVADAVVKELPEGAEAYCYLLSRIGQPIVEPQVFEVAVRCNDLGMGALPIQRVREAAHAEFMKIDTLWCESIKGELQLW